MEVERLLNPAFCAGLIARASIRYSSNERKVGTERAAGLPHLLSFLVLPLVLHAPTRDEINSHNANYGLHRFVRGRPDLLLGLDRRVEGFLAHTRAALLFGSSHGCLRFDSENLRVIAERRFAARLTGPRGLRDAAAAPVHAADRLGAWFAGASTGQVFLSLQLTP